MVFRAEASLLLLPKQTLTPDSVRTFALRRGVRGQAGYLDGRPAPPSIPKEKGRTTTLTTLTIVGCMDRGFAFRMILRIAYALGRRMGLFSSGGHF